MIEILQNKYQEIDKEIASLKSTLSKEISTDLPKECVTEINLTLSNPELKDILCKISSPDFFQTLNYENISDFYSVLEKTTNRLKYLKENADTEIFLKQGYRLSKEQVLLKFVGERKKESPNYDVDRLIELYENPPKELITYYDENKVLTIDSFVFRKKLIAINQMVLDKMDLLTCYIGKEGAGKSCLMSQDLYITWWILKELKLITYEFKINDIMFSSLEKYKDAREKFQHEPYRLLALDEGNELNRQNWKDPQVVDYFQRLRREARYHRRLNYIALPVLGELISNIVLSRLNFVFEVEMFNDTKSGSLNKGEYKYYIIPRADTIYSPELKRELTSAEIKNKLYERLKDKSYLISMPEGIITKKGRFNGVWGFREDEYNKELKDTSDTFTVNKGITVSELKAFYIYKANIKMSRLGIKMGDVRYDSLAKFFKEVMNYFEKRPELLMKYEAIYKRKMEQKKSHSVTDEEDKEDDVTRMANPELKPEPEDDIVPDFTLTDAPPSFPIEEEEEQEVDLDSVQTDAEELFAEQKRGYK